MENEKNIEELLKSKHGKDEYPPMHTAEHLLNQTMVRMFGCGRSENAHIERKKSKISFSLASCPTDAQVSEIEERMNELIKEDLPVCAKIMKIDEVPTNLSLDRMPDGNDFVRVVTIGNYDICPCAGSHVGRTSEIGKFILLGTNWYPEENRFRIRFKLEKPKTE